MAQQQVTDVTIPPGIGVTSEAYSSSGQTANPGGGSVFGDLGGPGQQQGTGLPMAVQDGPRNTYGIPTGNPSGDTADDSAPDIADAPPPGSVFGDLGGGGVACQLTGGEVPALPVGSDPGGQGGR
jgi:hypothetical protein